ncbi:NAD+ synthase [Halorussus halophilus]|uniref:NAD+ synthase n=1 Tax=Halorussus halophilus TaxID=2650975 RepID=UPI0013018E1F|nr:NAD+ synthase [Halorussus halophilus]
MTALRVALAQLNYTVGDVDGNREKVAGAVERARKADADLLVCSELALLGYPPRDLVEREDFVAAQMDALDSVATLTDDDLALLVGFADPNPDATGRPLYNAAAFCTGGELRGTTHKRLLPTYDVFEEDRYFERGESIVTHGLNGTTLGVHVCEDAWNEPDVWERPRYEQDPIEDLADAGADLLVNLSASPFYVGKRAFRERLMAGHATDHGLPLVFVNQVGANDEVVFDGRSFVVDSDGAFGCRLAAFEEEFAVCEIGEVRVNEVNEDLEAERRSRGAGELARASGVSERPEAIGAAFDDTELVRRAIRLGIRDYVHKSGFEGVVLGLSGGVDSSVTAALAAESLGPENVLGVAMATRYTSDASEKDAATLADNLGIEFREIPIEETFESFTAQFDSLGSVAKENLQARIRGTTLMALANDSGRLVLATGNKSELATGYCTLYGDMVGALAPLADCRKATVYALARRVNESSEGRVIPERVLNRPPSAELAPDQTDQDTLPPYETLDEILRLYVAEGATSEAVVAAGHDPAVVREVLSMLHSSEFKRWQAAPVLKVTAKAFGVGWRYPLAASYETVIN